MLIGHAVGSGITLKHLVYVQRIQRVGIVIPFQGAFHDLGVLGVQDFHVRSHHERFDPVAEIADEFAARIDDFELRVSAPGGDGFQPGFDGLPYPFNAFQLLRSRNGQAPHRCLMARGIHEADALGATFPEAHGYGGTAVAPSFGTAGFLQDMQVPEGRIVDAVREAAGGRLCERPDIELSHTVTVDGPAARHEEVTGCENGEIRPRSVRFGLRADGGVVVAGAVDEVPSLVFNAFTGLDHSGVPIPKIRDGADDKFGLTVRAIEPKDPVSRVVRGRAYDMDVEGT